MYTEFDHYFVRLQNSINKHWDSDALCDYRGKSMTFGQMATSIAQIHTFFETAGIKKEDHIALCAKNCASWALSFISVASYETVVVPILVDFKPDSIQKLVTHSDSIMLMTDNDTWKKLDINAMPGLKAVINIENTELMYCNDEAIKTAHDNLVENFKAKYPEGLKKEDVKALLPTDNMDKLSVINYTSGSTGDPKGVMLTHRSLSAGIDYGHRHIPVYPGDHMVSMLPMAHIYGLAFEFLYPLSGGATIHYLGKSPSPTLLLQAMKDVRPYLICTVPLVMEKIYKASLKPVLSKPVMKVLTKMPGLNMIIFNKVREKLDGAFGGRVREYVMGGAPLNPEVEDCFRKIKLHYTVGYGMTEASPLLAYASWKTYAKRSCGRSVDCGDARIDSADPTKIVGEIQAIGPNICIGYYKNEKATKELFTEDRYIHTGDLGLIDKDGNIFIKGRSKNMILSANGQNIYPEEVEAVVNNQEYVAESVVADRDTKLVALVYLNPDAMKRDGIGYEQIETVRNNILNGANESLPVYSKIAKVELRDEPFEKTPKMSIKRFLYS